MKPFEYVRPKTIAEAVAAASEPGAVYLAAGTNLLDLMKGGVSRPSRLVDITHLPGLDEIENLPDGGVRIGALTRNAELAHDGDFARRFPAVAEALLSGASAQLRNAATVGGNLLQRTRCAYFYDAASACNKREPGAGCDARGGDNRLHAVMGWSESCIATHPSDFCVPLIALGAIVEVEGKAGRREIPLENFHLLPGNTPDRETALEPGALIGRAPAGASRAIRGAYALSESARAHILCIRRGLGRSGSAHRERGDQRSPHRARRRGAQALASTRSRRGRGARADAATFRRAAAAAVAAAKPSGDNAFKIELARRIVTRSLMLAAAGTPERMPALPASPFAAISGVAAHA